MRFSHRYDCVAIANRFLHQPFRFHLPGQVVDDLGQRDRQPAAQHAFCFNFSLCLSRAGLGSMVAFSVEIAAKKRRFWHRSRSITLMSPLKPARKQQQPFVSASLMHAQSLSWQMIIISCKKTALQNKPFRFVLILVLLPTARSPRSRRPNASAVFRVCFCTRNSSGSPAPLPLVLSRSLALRRNKKTQRVPVVFSVSLCLSRACLGKTDRFHSRIDRNGLLTN